MTSSAFVVYSHWLLRARLYKSERHIVFELYTAEINYKFLTKLLYSICFLLFVCL